VGDESALPGPRVHQSALPPAAGRAAPPRILRTMDQGLPIAYQVLQPGVAVQAASGEFVGTVERVIAAPEQDIFEGIVIRTVAGARFVPAEDVASLHERGDDLKLDAAQVEALGEPTGAAALDYDAGAPALEDSAGGNYQAPYGAPGRAWFGTKPFGRGYRPQGWPGYLVMAALTATSLVLRTAGSDHHSNLTLLLILPAIIILVLMRTRQRR
jgi:hypothetical protein